MYTREKRILKKLKKGVDKCESARYNGRSPTGKIEKGRCTKMEAKLDPKTLRISLDPMAEAIAAIANHDALRSIAWTDLQRSRCAALEHAEILVAIVNGDYCDGMTAAETRRAIADGEADIGDYDTMSRYYVYYADKIAAALAPYVTKAADGDEAARHVLVAMRKRKTWETVCRAADGVGTSRLRAALASL